VGEGQFGGKERAFVVPAVLLTMKAKHRHLIVAFELGRQFAFDVGSTYL